MGSMAFWYERANNAGASDSELSAVMNFNLWTQCGAKKSKSQVDGINKATSFLDVGFLISNIQRSKKLYFFIPYKITEPADLSLNIKDSTTIGAIFNETYSVTDIGDNSEFWPVTNTNGKAFVIYSWKNRQPSPVSFDKDVGILEINTVELQNNIRNFADDRVEAEDDFYFRFRINIPDSPKQHNLVRRYKPKDSFLQSSFATTFIVDFRFNDPRSLPEKITKKIKESGNAFVPVKKLHFLLMTKASVDVETSANNIILRELEEEIWDKYVDNRFEIKDIVAYHSPNKAEVDQGKSIKPIQQWEFFAKLKVNNSSKKVIMVYLGSLILITVLLNLASSVLYDLISDLIESLKNVGIP